MFDIGVQPPKHVYLETCTIDPTSTRIDDDYDRTVLVKVEGAYYKSVVVNGDDIIGEDKHEIERSYNFRMKLIVLRSGLEYINYINSQAEKKLQSLFWTGPDQLFLCEKIVFKAIISEHNSESNRIDVLFRKVHYEKTTSLEDELIDRIALAIIGKKEMEYGERLSWGCGNVGADEAFCEKLTKSITKQMQRSDNDILVRKAESSEISTYRVNYACSLFFKVGIGCSEIFVGFRTHGSYVKIFL